eukprot:5517051-Alexandrium_andersonii.AAC.1
MQSQHRRTRRAFGAAAPDGEVVGAKRARPPVDFGGARADVWADGASAFGRPAPCSSGAQTQSRRKG